MKIKEIRFIDPMRYMGKSILIQLKSQAQPFLFKVTGFKNDPIVIIPGDIDKPAIERPGISLTGYDAEGLDLSIDLDDIDYVIGG